MSDFNDSQSRAGAWHPLVPLLLLLVTGLPALGDPPDTAEAERPRETRVQRTRGYVGNLGRFGGAIVLSEAGKGVFAGDQDAVGDALRAPATPEFLTGLAIFDGAIRSGNALVRRLPSAGQLGNALKQNLVLAGALTVTSAVEVDLNGFRYRDLTRGDFSRLQGASVGLRTVDGQSLAITMGSFAAAQGIWNGAKRLGQPFAAAVTRRLAKTAAIKAALTVAPVPGSRVAALLLTGAEVALAVGDLAGLLMTAQAIDEPLQAANERRRRSGAVAEAEDSVARSARASNQDHLMKALGRLRNARARQRAEAYTRAARQDLAMIRRLRERGANPDVFNKIAQQALGDYGAGLALPALSALLLEHLPEEVAAGRLTPAALARHRMRVVRAQAEAAEARDASYAAEDRAYADLLRGPLNPTARAAIQAAREEAALEAEIEREDIRNRTRPQAAAVAPPAKPAPTPARSAHRGILGAFGGRVEPSVPARSESQTSRSSRQRSQNTNQR
ncbi:MAG: hypothetical protein JKY65_17670 [Planctomycetes bacterium]|nr:hypothetical protein [Planctomycetota bacterium]